jgi:hypothetical protein
MKNIIKFFFALVLMMSVSGCQEDYLETASSSDISDVNMYTDVSGCQYVLSGVYRYMRAATQNSGSGVLTTLRNCTSVYGDEMCVIKIGNSFNYWYEHSYNYNLINTTSSDPKNNWSYFYTMIVNCNDIMDHLDAANGDDEEKEYIKGQCLAIRAYSYFWLVRLFAPPVDTELGIPLYESVNVEGNPRSTVAEVYTQIKIDMNAAIGLLEGYDRPDKHYINKQVVQGMLAYVYLTHEEWALAAELANEARQGFPLMTREEFRSGHNDENLGEWMWDITQQEDQKFPWASPLRFWGTYGGIDLDYKTWKARFFVSKNLANQIEETDVRYQFYDYLEEILTIDGNDTIFYTATDKFWESYRTDDYMMGDVCWMRGAEMYLIEAEGLLRSGDVPGATIVLNELQTTREATPTAATLDNILLERSKELYGEGYSYFDLIRNGLPVVRTYPQRSYDGMPANDWSWIEQIPLDEITSNPNISEADQNPIEGSYR